LRAEGATDYYVQPLAFTNGQVSYASFATDTHDGFSDACLAALDAIGPVLARRLELESAYYATAALLDVYLGRNASRRVLAGALRPAEVGGLAGRSWSAAERAPSPPPDAPPASKVSASPHASFEAVASGGPAPGAEAIKFTGAAVFALFPIDRAPRSSCRDAL